MKSNLTIELVWFLKGGHGGEISTSGAEIFTIWGKINSLLRGESFHVDRSTSCFLWLKVAWDGIYSCHAAYTPRFAAAILVSLEDVCWLFKNIFEDKKVKTFISVRSRCCIPTRKFDLHRNFETIGTILDIIISHQFTSFTHKTFKHENTKILANTFWQVWVMIIVEIWWSLKMDLNKTQVCEIWQHTRV